MGILKDFTLSAARPLPVIIMADVSGSMAADGKIDALNTALKEMIASFAAEEEGNAEIQVAVLSFGRDVCWSQELEPASQVEWVPLAARGPTPLGMALGEVTAMLNDQNKIKSRAYSPSVILLSDGQPTDDWEGPLSDFLGSKRAAKAQRFALAIGEDAQEDVLMRFLDNPEARVFRAHEAREIQKFFRWVTMSVTFRSRSSSPEQLVSIDPLSLDDYGDF